MAFLNPSEVLNNLDLKPDMSAAEFGCGSGAWVIILAKRLPDGLVYGLDIQQEPLDVLQSQSRQEKAVNIRTIRCDLEKERGSTLPKESMDIVLIPNLLFQVEDTNAIIKEAWRVLKNGGQILVVDWLLAAPLGPTEGRVSAQEVKDAAERLGLGVKREFQAGSCHWGLILTK